ncbi:NAD(P)/FAD-dependent oxidoreductase [Actinomadura opuntiae]|uniref:NAD(P)/FAD-dependent oxidoreductase n=1 Tax=Actinomadura sp. OS1-43 TaxID=604315 RepID=UPI00255A7320|nr:FAD-binding oxidoreductase [Actinomadura sp. OS1-43]MDL4813029.1 FAD-binding oxidoreductase [Actinomadura sp. OS1-43]
MADWRTRSLWLSRGPYEPMPPLDGDLDVDIVVVGAGFTGLWAAIHLKRADPSVDVAVLEQQVAGYGASGRNGGFAMTMVGRNLHDLVRKVGPARARATRLAMRGTLSDIAGFVRAEGIDADLTRPGLLTVSNGPEQDERIRQDLVASRRLGLDDLRYLSARECRDLVAADRVRCGHFEEDALLLDPAALTRGLRDAAVRLGVRVFESTPVHSLALPGTHVLARTPGGTVRADRALLATNAYAHAVPALRRWLFTIVASIIVTEPLTGEQWKRAGWQSGAGVEDKRIMPHFHRPTLDGRILWGGRDAPFAPGGPDPGRDRSPQVFRRLEETFRLTFPQLADVRIDRGWCGPVAGTVNCFAHAGRLGRGRRVVYALGYAGHGVGPSHLTARIARDLLLDRDSEVLDLPMAAERPVPLPPGPLRGLVLNGAQHVLQRADDGDRGPLTGLALRFLQ